VNSRKHFQGCSINSMDLNNRMASYVTTQATYITIRGTVGTQLM